MMAVANLSSPPASAPATHGQIQRELDKWRMRWLLARQDGQSCGMAVSECMEHLDKWLDISLDLRGR